MSGTSSLDVRVNNNTSSLALNGLNTFSGNANMVTGQVNANTLADSGVASSLGTGGVINMGGGGGQTPLLWYTGTGATSTNRLIQSRSTSDNRIVAQDGALDLTGTLTGGSGTNTFKYFFSGTADSDINTVSGTITDGATSTIEVGLKSTTPVGGSAEAGVWEFSGANTYSGATTVANSSTLVISNSDALGSTTGATVVSTNSQLVLSGGIAVGAEALTLNSAATAVWNGQTGAALRNFSGDNSWAGDVTLGQDTTIAANTGTTLTISGSLSGGFGLTKADTGTLILAGVKSYTGDTNIDGGTLRLVNTTDLAGLSSSNININNGSTLEIFSDVGGSNRTTVSNGKTFTFDSAGGGTIVYDKGNHLWQNSAGKFVTTGGSQNTISSANGGFINPQNTNTVNFDVADGTDPVDLLVSVAIGSGNLVKDGLGTMSLTSSSTLGGGGNLGLKQAKACLPFL